MCKYVQASQVALVGKNPPANARVIRLRFSPWVWKITCRWHGNLLQYSCLENPTDRGAIWATVHWLLPESDTTEMT